MTNPYRKDVRHLDEIDIYQIGNLYEVKSHAVFHALKKLLCAGKRGAKDYEQDLMEAIESIERELQIVGGTEQEEEYCAGPNSSVDFDEQRIDVIGQNGGDPHYDDWRLKVDWSLASPHHQWASKKANGDYGFSMHEPMAVEYIGRPVAQ